MVKTVEIRTSIHHSFQVLHCLLYIIRSRITTSLAVCSTPAVAGVRPWTPVMCGESYICDSFPLGDKTQDTTQLTHDARRTSDMFGY